MIAWIPAKGTSNRVPNKNIRNLCGYPLFYWSAITAINVLGRSSVFVSTDCEKIIEQCNKFNINYWRRPSDLALSTTTTHSVLKYHIDNEKIFKNYTSDVMTLQPTSPLRNEADIKRCLCAWKKRNKTIKSLVSVVKVPHIFNKDEQFEISGNVKKNYISLNHNGISQNKISYFVRNGAAVYISSNSIIREYIFDNNFMPIEMSSENSIDIDEEIDFLLAKTLMERLKI